MTDKSYARCPAANEKNFPSWLIFLLVILYIEKYPQNFIENLVEKTGGILIFQNRKDSS